MSDEKHLPLTAAVEKQAFDPIQFIIESDGFKAAFNMRVYDGVEMYQRKESSPIAIKMYRDQAVAHYLEHMMQATDLAALIRANNVPSTIKSAFLTNYSTHNKDGNPIQNPAALYDVNNNTEISVNQIWKNLVARYKIHELAIQSKKAKEADRNEARFKLHQDATVKENKSFYPKDEGKAYRPPTSVATFDPIKHVENTEGFRVYLKNHNLINKENGDEYQYLSGSAILPAKKVVVSYLSQLNQKNFEALINGDGVPSSVKENYQSKVGVQKTSGATVYFTTSDKTISPPTMSGPAGVWFKLAELHATLASTATIPTTKPIISTSTTDLSPKPSAPTASMVHNTTSVVNHNAALDLNSVSFQKQKTELKDTIIAAILNDGNFKDQFEEKEGKYIAKAQQPTAVNQKPVLFLTPAAATGEYLDRAVLGEFSTTEGTGGKKIFILGTTAATDDTIGTKYGTYQQACQAYIQKKYNIKVPDNMLNMFSGPQAQSKTAAQAPGAPRMHISVKLNQLQNERDNIDYEIKQLTSKLEKFHAKVAGNHHSGFGGMGWFNKQPPKRMRVPEVLDSLEVRLNTEENRKILAETALRQLKEKAPNASCSIEEKNVEKATAAYSQAKSTFDAYSGSLTNLTSLKEKRESLSNEIAGWQAKQQEETQLSQAERAAYWDMVGHQLSFQATNATKIMVGIGLIGSGIYGLQAAFNKDFPVPNGANGATTAISILIMVASVAAIGIGTALLFSGSTNAYKGSDKTSGLAEKHEEAAQALQHIRPSYTLSNIA